MKKGKDFRARLIAGTRQGAVVGGGIGALAGVALQAIFIVLRGWIPDAATTVAVAALGIVIFGLGGAWFGILIGGALGAVAGALEGWHAFAALRASYLRRISTGRESMAHARRGMPSLPGEGGGMPSLPGERVRTWTLPPEELP